MSGLCTAECITNPLSRRLLDAHRGATAATSVTTGSKYPPRLKSQ